MYRPSRKSACPVRIWDMVRDRSPPKTPHQLLDRLNKTVNEILSEPAVKSKFADLGVQPVGGTLAETNTFIARERHRWGELFAQPGSRPTKPHFDRIRGVIKDRVKSATPPTLIRQGKLPRSPCASQQSGDRRPTRITNEHRVCFSEMNSRRFLYKWRGMFLWFRLVLKQTNEKPNQQLLPQ